MTSLTITPKYMAHCNISSDTYSDCTILYCINSGRNDICQGMQSETLRNNPKADDNRSITLFRFMTIIIERLINTGKTRTAETYASALSSFKKYRQNIDIAVCLISPDIIEDYQSWLQQKGVSRNTSSFYNRILRAVYNRAVEKSLTIQRYPFKHVYTGVDKTKKRALPISVLRRIKYLDISKNSMLDFARDMFLMSFYLRGMSFIDMAFLRKIDLQCGYIRYRRRKTGQLLSILWTTEMQHIIDKYPKSPTQYLLPIITENIGNERIVYRNAAAKINRWLKKLADKVGSPIPITLYCARHSWASAAKSKHIPINVISESMGHDSEKTTQIYLSELNSDILDRANSQIISSI